MDQEGAREVHRGAGSSTPTSRPQLSRRPHSRVEKSIRVHLAGRKIRCYSAILRHIQRATRVGSTHAAKDCKIAVCDSAGRRECNQGYARSVKRVYPGPKVGRRRALSAVIELLLCWLVSRTYKLYCSGSKVALGLSLRARLLAPPLATAARKYLRYANYDA